MLMRNCLVSFCFLPPYSLQANLNGENILNLQLKVGIKLCSDDRKERRKPYFIVIYCLSQFDILTVHASGKILSNMSNEGCASDKWQWLALAHQRHESAATHRRIEAKIISLVIEYHLSTGGSCDTVLDVCCGNGESTRLLATHFIAALGIDRSEKNVRRSSILSEILDPDEIAAGRIKFAVGNESNLSQSTQDISSNGKVDLVAVCGIVCHFQPST